ncbi:NAD-dependent epimerase/dehydratase family protein [bacterium]|jgi:UDP-glucose 4-epimerase|nr:NAD-dependent epimerase/dehydratase family protein [bacterium]
MKFTKNKAFITGGAGFIGSNIVDRLLSLGHRVVVYDNFSTGQINFLKNAKKNKNLTILKGDLLDQKLLDRSITDCNIVYHMAANADIRGGLEKPYYDIEQNTIATFNLLESMRKNNLKRIIFASSAAALGEPSEFPTPESCPTPVQTSLYGASKMACEGLISSYCEGYGFEGYVFRFVSLLGSRYPHGHVFDFVKQLKENPSKLRVLGDGTQRKSYMHISDCIDAILLTAEQKRTALNTKHNFDVYHLGFPSYISLMDSISIISNQMNLSPQLDFSGGDRGWVGDNPFVFLDIHKAQRHGWNPKYNIEYSIRKTVDWLTNNDWIFESRV